MREAVKDFIERVITDDYTIIRVEANDMLPKVGTKNELLDKVDGLYVLTFAVNIDCVTIVATYYAV